MVASVKPSSPNVKRGAAKIYVTARDPASLSVLLQDGDSRLVPLTLDVTDPAQVDAAAIAVPDVTLLVNNAGDAAFEGAISASDLTGARQEMEVNYFGPLALPRAFKPVLAASGGGAVLNMLSMVALVSLPMAATYSASKAAFLSLTRSIRAELAAQNTLVFGVMAVQTGTALGARLPSPRLTPREIVFDALDAVQADTNEEVFAGLCHAPPLRPSRLIPRRFKPRCQPGCPRWPERLELDHP
jgi:short-subunit dehydrogenase